MRHTSLIIGLFFATIPAFAEPKIPLRLSSNPELLISMSEGRVRANPATTEKGKYQISQPADGVYVLFAERGVSDRQDRFGNLPYLARVETRGDTSFLTETWMKPDPQNNKVWLEENRVVKWRPSDGQVQAVMICQGLAVHGSPNRMGFSLVKQQRHTAENCTLVDRPFCQLMESRGQWSWTGADGNKLKSLKQVREKIATCRSLADELAQSAAGRMGSESDFRENLELDAQVATLAKLAGDKKFPKASLLSTSDDPRLAAAARNSPLRDSVRALRALEDTLTACADLGASMEEKKEAQSTPAPKGAEDAATAAGNKSAN